MNELPGALGVTSTFPFVGRSAELERLRTLLPRADGEERPDRPARRRGGLGQEPARARVRRRGRRRRRRWSSTGRADAVVRTPYGPFVEALDQLARARPAELRARLGRRGRAGAAAPRPRQRGSRRRDADPDTERHRLHTAVADLLAGVTRRRAALLVLEDGHWADAATLLLLRHLARASGPRCCCWPRSATPTPTSPARWPRRWPTCAATTSCGCGCRASRTTRWPISCAARAASRRRARARALRCTRSPSGNAFLLCELWRALIETGAIELTGGAIRVHRAPEELGSPESVREVVSQRLARLAPRDDRPARARGDRRDGVRARRRPPRRRPGRRRAAGGARRGLPQRDDRRGPRPRARRGASRTSWCGARSTTGCPARAGRSCTCAWGRRSRAAGAARAARSPISRTTSRRPRPSGRRTAPSSTTRWRRARPPPRSRSTRRRRTCAPRIELAGDPRPEHLLELGEAEPPRRPRARGAGGVPGRCGDRPRARRRRAAGPRRDRLRGGVLAPEPDRARRGRAAAGGGRRARPRGLQPARRAARRARPRARHPGPPRARRRWRGRTRWRWRAGWRTAPGWRRC